MALIDNLVSYYPCYDDEANTTVVDVHGSNTGVASENTSGLHSASGIIDSTFDYDGTGDFFQVTDSVSLSVTNVTLSFWFKSSAHDDFAVLIAKGDGTQGVDYGVRYDNANHLTAMITTGAGSRIATTSVTYNDTDWHFAVLTFDGDTLLLYVDNSVVATNTDPSAESIRDTALPITSGRDATSGDSRAFTGLFCEAGIFSVAKDSSFVDEMWNSGTGLTYPFLPDVTISPSTFTLSTSEQSPSLFIDINQSSVFGLTAVLPTPTIIVPNPPLPNPNKGTVSTKEISKLTIPEGIGDVQNLIPQGINGLKSTVLIKNRVGLEL